MRWNKDGDQICVTLDDFEDLQVSPAVFIPCASEAGQAIQAGGILNMAIGDLRIVRDLLNSGGGEFGSLPTNLDPAAVTARIERPKRKPVAPVTVVSKVGPKRKPTGSFDEY